MEEWAWGITESDNVTFRKMLSHAFRIVHCLSPLIRTHGEANFIVAMPGGRNPQPSNSCAPFLWCFLT